MGVLKRMRWLKEYFRWIKESLPIIEGRKIHFTKDSLILIGTCLAGLLVGFYILGILVGEHF